jgi:hypothetical protein
MNFKRVVLPVFMFCIALLAVTTVGFANTQATPEQQADKAQFAVLVDKLLTNHYQGQVNSNYIGSDDILIDSENTYLWKKYSESRVHVSKIMAGGMRDYKYTIQSRKAEFSGDDIANYYIKLEIEYRYKDGADTPTRLYERKYRFIFQKNEGKWLIGNVASNEDFYLQFKEFIKKYLPSPASENDYRRTVDLVLQKVIQQARMLDKMLDEKNEQEKLEREKKKFPILY